MRGGIEKWTAEMDAFLLKAWGENKSARYIGYNLKVTRNSVLGRLTRLRARGFHIPLRQPAMHKGPRMKTEQHDPKDFELREKGCRWIDGDPLAKPIIWCNEDKQEGSSYCPHHHERTWVKRQEKVPDYVKIAPSAFALARMASAK